MSVEGHTGCDESHQFFFLLNSKKINLTTLTGSGYGPYKFMLWAGDGDPDTFRIKIWEDPDEENPIYDNGMDQPIGGGSIVVHTD